MLGFSSICIPHHNPKESKEYCLPWNSAIEHPTLADLTIFGNAQAHRVHNIERMYVACIRYGGLVIVLPPPPHNSNHNSSSIRLEPQQELYIANETSWAPCVSKVITSDVYLTMVTCKEIIVMNSLMYDSETVKYCTVPTSHKILINVGGGVEGGVPINRIS